MSEDIAEAGADHRPARRLAWFEQSGGLTAAEAQLVESVQAGRATVVNGGERPEPGDARPEITVRAELLRYLALGGCPACRPHEKGVRMVGARLSGMLDVEGCALAIPLVLVHCDVDSPVVLLFAEMGLLNLTGTRLQGGDGLPALVGDGLTCRAGVVLTQIEARGEVRLPQARIRGSLVGLNAAFAADGADAALNCEGAKIDGGAFLDGLRAEGPVRVGRAAVAGDVSLVGARFTAETSAAFNADGLECGGAIRLNQAACSGEARLLAARVGGNLECRGAHFEHPGDDALSLDGAVVGGSVMLREGFAAQGTTRLPNARIGQSLECADAVFAQPGGTAFSADGLRVGGTAVLGRGFRAEGEVRMVGASMVGAFDADGGCFDNPGATALSLEAAQIGGGLFLRSRGRVADGPMFRGRLELGGARAGVLVDAPQDWPAPGELILDGFVFDRIDGEAAPKDAGRRRDWLMRQIPEHLGTDFRTQPWEQLAKVLRMAGKPLEARRIGVARERARLRGGQISWWAQPLHRLYGVIAGYGFFTLRALVFAAAFWAFGALLFAGAWQGGAFAPRGSALFEDPAWAACARDPAVADAAACWTAPGQPGADFEPFSAWLYSFDVLIPFVAIELEASWSPAPGRGRALLALGGDGPAITIGDLAWAYRIFHELVGFLLAGFAAAGAARLAREE